MKVGTQHGDSDPILRACAAFGVSNICGRLPSRPLPMSVSEDMRVHATPLATQPTLDQYAGVRGFGRGRRRLRGDAHRVHPHGRGQRWLDPRERSHRSKGGGVGSLRSPRAALSFQLQLSALSAVSAES
jgi:hypothetical protein